MPWCDSIIVRRVRASSAIAVSEVACSRIFGMLSDRSLDGAALMLSRRA